jgi:hypothetical protein
MVIFPKKIKLSAFTVATFIFRRVEGLLSEDFPTFF